MPRISSLAIAILLAMPASSFAQFGGMSQPKPKPEVWKVELTMADDRAIAGAMPLAALEIVCEIGHYAIKPDKIKEVRFEPKEDAQWIAGPGGLLIDGTIVTTSGEELRGSIAFPGDGIETDLGTLRPNPKKLRLLAFRGKKGE